MQLKERGINLLKRKGYLGGLFALAAVVIIVMILVPGAQSKSNDLIGVVDMETVFTQYMAQPLFEARDQLQADFDQQVDEVSDEELAELFMEYQTELEAVEIEYLENVNKALEEVAQENGLQIIVDSGAILYGGIDVTEEIIAVLN